jgi:peptidoglycan hydrolase-like protein with peptidoglycan-binding domain
MGLGIPTAAATTHAYGEMVEYPLTFPVNGPASFTDSFYSARTTGEHHAQDLMASKMVPVVAAAAGTVRYVNWSHDPNDLNPERCCTLVIRHDDGWESWYLHLTNDTPGTDDGLGWGIAPGIAVGVHVAAGDLIGWVGDSGNAEATSPHLHFELYDPEGVVVNPYAALKAAQANCTGDCYPFNNLAYGSRGAAVSELQRALAAAGYPPGPIDGIFGSKTRAAVVAFQTANGLPVTGVIDRTSWETLNALPPPVVPPPVVPPPVPPTVEPTPTVGPVVTVIASIGSRGAIVVELQRKLLAAGYSPGVIDGIFGRKTEGATKAFQTAKSLPASGVVDQATWDAFTAPPVVVDPAPVAVPDPNDVVLAYWSRGSAVVDLQRLLAAAGYNPGTIDGVFGPKTRAAVLAFQQAKGLATTGLVTRATLEALTA